MVKCHNCSRKGHFKKDCKQAKKEKAYLARKDGDDENQSLLMMQVCEITMAADEVRREVLFLNEEKVIPKKLKRMEETFGTWTQG
jgi:hypothetical protein